MASAVTLEEFHPFERDRQKVVATAPLAAGNA
jgi:hypothetical protein